jgi:hypothetical protein
MGIQRKKLVNTPVRHNNPAYENTPTRTPTRNTPTRTTPIRNRLRNRLVGRNGQAVQRDMLSYRGRGSQFGIMHDSPTNPRNLIRMQPRVMVENILNLSNYAETSFTSNQSTEPATSLPRTPPQPPKQTTQPQAINEPPVINKNTDGTGPGPSGVQYTKDNKIKFKEKPIHKNKLPHFSIRNRFKNKYTFPKPSNNISGKQLIPMTTPIKPKQPIATSTPIRPTIPQPKGILKPTPIPKPKPTYIPKHYVTNKPTPPNYKPSSTMLGFGADTTTKIGVGYGTGIGKETTKLGAIVKGGAKASLIIGLSLTLGQIFYGIGDYYQDKRMTNKDFLKLHWEIKQVIPRLITMQRYVQEFRDWKFKHNPFNDNIQKALDRLISQSLNIEKLVFKSKDSMIGYTVDENQRNSYTNLYRQILSVVNEVNKQIKPTPKLEAQLTLEECIAIKKLKDKIMKDQEEWDYQEERLIYGTNPVKLEVWERIRNVINPVTNELFNTPDEYYDLPYKHRVKIYNKYVRAENMPIESENENEVDDTNSPDEQTTVQQATSGDGGIGVAENQPIPEPSVSERETEVNEQEASQDDILRCKICNMPLSTDAARRLWKKLFGALHPTGPLHLYRFIIRRGTTRQEHMENIRNAVWGKCIHCRQEFTPEARLRSQVYMMQLQQFAHPSLGDAFVFNQ